MFVALTDLWQLLQLVHYLVHGFLDGLGQVAVGLLTLDRFQLCRERLHQFLHLRVVADTSCHLLCEFSDGPVCLPHQLIPRLRFLLVGVKHLLLEDLIGQLRLDFADALPRQVCLTGHH